MSPFRSSYDRRTYIVYIGVPHDVNGHKELWNETIKIQINVADFNRRCLCVHRYEYYLNTIIADVVIHEHDEFV